MTGTAAAPVPAFALRGLGKSFGAIRACQEISFDIWPGDVIGLAGENGAGKSTSMKCLVGWIVPSEGHVECHGQPVQFRSPRDAEAAGIAVIPQELDLFPDLPVYENVHAGMAWPRRRTGLFDRPAMKAQTRRLLGRLGADLDVDRPVRTLAPAQQKLVQIARALNQNARLLVMDEPTAALTAVESDRLFRVIHDLRAGGTAVIHITHRLDEIFRHCNRVVVLRDGRQTGAGAIADYDTASLIRAMVGRTVDQFYRRQFRATGGEILLETRGLGRGTQFRDISLTLRAGEILGMAGLIGAGRTAIAQALAGIHPADTGEVRLRGTPVRLRSPAEAMRHGIAHLPEERRSQGLHLPFPITWNMSFGILPAISRFGFVDERRETALATTAARDFALRAASLDMPVGSLSGGNQQKVLMAKVLAPVPDVVILDEPTRGVDVGAKAEIYALIEGLARAGKAILLISSEIEELLALSDRIATVHQGRINRILERPEFSADAVGFSISGQVAHV